MRYITQIPNINNIVPNYVGGNVSLFVDDINKSFKVSRDREVKSDSLIYVIDSGTTNHKAILDYLLQVEAENKKTNSSTTTFEQFNNILQTTALLTVAGGAIYYFFFYKNKGKK